MYCTIAIRVLMPPILSHVVAQQRYFRLTKVREVRVPAWSILAVTFTRKAAEEMRSRVRDTLGENEASKIAMGTFHSICARILRRHGDALPTVVPGLDSSFSIFDTDDARRLMTDIFNQDGINKSEASLYV